MTDTELLKEEFNKRVAEVRPPKWPVREFLKTIYDPETSEEQREELRKSLLERRKEIVQDIALYNGIERELAKRFLAETEEPEKEIKPVEAVPEPSVAKIDELATQYSYAEVLAMAKQHDIQSGPKIKMISKLIEKRIL